MRDPMLAVYVFAFTCIMLSFSGLKYLYRSSEQKGALRSFLTMMSRVFLTHLSGKEQRDGVTFYTFKPFPIDEHTLHVELLRHDEKLGLLARVRLRVFSCPICCASAQPTSVARRYPQGI